MRVEPKFMLRLFGTMALLVLPTALSAEVNMLEKDQFPSQENVSKREPMRKHLFATKEEAANKGLESLRGLQSRIIPGDARSKREVNDYARLLGFESAAEAAIAQLGDPFVVYEVPLDRLKEFQKGGEPNTLLSSTSRVFYPITIQGQARSSLTVVEVERGKSWSAGRLGYARFIRMLDKYRQKNPDATSLVLVSALGLRFLSEMKAEQLMLILVADEPKFGLQPGEEVAAHKVFPRLVEEAKIVAEKQAKLRKARKEHPPKAQRFKHKQ